MSEEYEAPNERPKPTPNPPKNNYVASVENLQNSIDEIKKSIEIINGRLDNMENNYDLEKRIDNSLDHIKQLNDKLAYLEQKLRASGIRLRK